jgi:hypothetical protein
MKTFKTTLIVLSCIIFGNTLFSCEEENKTDYKPYLIKIESIKLPEQINATEPFDIHFFGTVGTNGCFQFHEFKTETKDNNIIVEVWGRINNNAEICPSVMVYLEGKELTHTIQKIGNYTLKIKQPDGSYLVEQILVK